MGTPAQNKAMAHARAEKNKKSKQGYNSRLDESLGGRNKGKHKQSLKDRRDESKGEAKSMGKRAYSGVKAMDKYKHGAVPRF